MHLAVAQSNYTGIYLGLNYEKDSTQIALAEVLHKLVLNKDSSFIYSKTSNSTICNSTYAGSWKKNREMLILSFLGENPLSMLINEGAGFCSLENRAEQLTLVKQTSMHYEPFDPYAHPKQSKGKKTRDTPCPRF